MVRVAVDANGYTDLCRGDRAVVEAIKLVGYQGLSRRKVCRDVKLCTIGEGTSEIQRLVIARQLLEGSTESH